MNESLAWRTADELLFISNLGRSPSQCDAHGKTRAELLQGYLDALPLRKRWGGVEVRKVQFAAADALHAELAAGGLIG